MHELTFASTALMICVAAGAYLAGCCNGAIITSFLFYRDDIRRHGSHNAGLTNFYRVYGKKFAICVILVDMLKAFVAVKLGSAVFDAYLGLRLEGEYFSALFCVIGHIFPAFYSFKGGKGILCSGTLRCCWTGALRRSAGDCLRCCGSQRGMSRSDLYRVQSASRSQH